MKNPVTINMTGELGEFAITILSDRFKEETIHDDATNFINALIVGLLRQTVHKTWISYTSEKENEHD